MTPSRSRFRNSRLPIEPGSVEAPITAMDRGTKMGPSDAVTARRSFSPHAAIELSDSSTGKSTVYMPSSRVRVSSNPELRNTRIIWRFSGRTYALKRLMPWLRAYEVNRSSNSVPTPRPWWSSATAKATSAVDGSSARASYRPTPMKRSWAMATSAIRSW